ncbi:zinc transporter ttm-1 isoform X2 [Manduca sexta]|uniref:zinc transporter ttm-1 isoform X2 n=1 Tax=Manduca sexta TaxID=7130 RepID=UPI00188F4841|nr:zinc transporter ttm-1 isoform X2 [Manduca sexta]
MFRLNETYTDVPVTPAPDTEHCHWKPHAEPPSAIPQLLTALVLCGFFMVCELIGGYLAGSLSVMSDAAHMLSDCGGFALALLAFHCAKRKPDVHMSYGYKRAEVLGAMVSVLLIWILTGVFVYVAATRLHSGEYNIEPDIMMIVSGCGVGFNVILAVVLHGCASDIAHHHSHGGAACAHAHGPSEPRPRFKLFHRSREHKHANGLVNGDYSMKDLSSAEANVVGARARNINLRAALIHVIGDLIQSCGVLLASVLIKFYPEAKVVDPICTFLFSVLVLLTSARVVRDALNMLMQAVPKDFRYRECAAALSGVAGVRHVHSLHAWALSTHHVVLTAHLAIGNHHYTHTHTHTHTYRECAAALSGVAGVRHVHSLHAWALSTHHVVLTAHLAIGNHHYTHTHTHTHTYRECAAALSGVAGVRHVHSLHAWALSTHHVVLTAHLAIGNHHYTHTHTHTHTYRECAAALSGVAGVRHVHSLHAWALSTHHVVLTAHLAIGNHHYTHTHTHTHTYRECAAALSGVAGVRHVHSLHAWALSTHHVVLTAHLAIGNHHYTHTHTHTHTYRECAAALSGVAGVRHVHSLHAWALSTHHVVLTAHLAIGNHHYTHTHTHTHTYRECAAALSGVAGVRHVHSLHAWALSTHHVVLTAHLAIDELTDPETVLHACQQLARVEFGAHSGTFQVERWNARMASCEQCRLQPGAQP